MNIHKRLLIKLNRRKIRNLKIKLNNDSPIYIIFFYIIKMRKSKINLNLREERLLGAASFS